MKKIKVYAVCKNCGTRDESLKNIYTILEKKKQALEYTLEYTLCRLHIEYQSHFDAWCELHNEDSSLVDTFKRYMEKVHNNEPYNDFVIISLLYDKKSLCSLLRILSGCIPVGASYELDEEVTKFLEMTKPRENKDKQE